MQRKVLVIIGASAGVSVALAIAVNIATGIAPHWMIALRSWAWALVAALGLAATALAVWQRRLEGFREPPMSATGPGRGAPRELPRDISQFTARRHELDRLSAMARKTGMVAIAGKPGIGKSALAIHAAHALAERYPDGQIFLDLKGLAGSPLTVQAGMLHVIRAFGQLGTAEDTDEQLTVRYRSVLAVKHAILILDDAESESQVRPLLPPNRRCLVLITSRRVLVGLTEAPPPLVLDTLHQQDALAMLSAICGTSRISAEPDASAVLVQQCGALPLALRIAAARLRRRPYWDVSDLVSRLRDERRRLDELRVADLEVRACIALSYADLAAADARSFRRLSVVPGRDFTPEIAGAAIGSAPPAAKNVLDNLADAQLLEQQSATRYRYHDLIRLFALERFNDEDGVVEHDAALRRTLTVYSVQLDTAANVMNVASSVGAKALRPADPVGQLVDVPFRNREPDAAQWMQTERNNLLAALFAAQKFDDGIAWKLAGSILLYLENRSSLAELRAVLAVAEQAARRLDSPDYVMSALYFRGRADRLAGKVKAATSALRTSAQYFLETDRQAQASEIFLVLGQTCRENGLLDEAAGALTAAFRLRLAQHDQAGAAGVLIEVAIVMKDHGQLDDAARVLDFAISLLESEPESAHSLVRLAWARENLGATLKRLGRTAEATAQHEASLAAFTELGHVRGQAYAVRNLGDLALQAGALREAGQLYTRSLHLFRTVGDLRGEAQALGHLSLVGLRTRHWLRGLGSLVRAIVIAQRANSMRALLGQLRHSSSRSARGQATPAAHRSLAQLAAEIEETRISGV